MTAVEFGKEVSGTSLLRLVEVAHYVGLLLPDVDGFLELHLTLEFKKQAQRKILVDEITAANTDDCNWANSLLVQKVSLNNNGKFSDLCESCFYLNDKHVNYTGVSDVLIFIKHLPHFVSSLARCDVQLKCRNCEERKVRKESPNCSTA